MGLSWKPILRPVEIRVSISTSMLVDGTTSIEDLKKRMAEIAIDYIRQFGDKAITFEYMESQIR